MSVSHLQMRRGKIKKLEEAKKVLPERCLKLDKLLSGVNDL